MGWWNYPIEVADRLLRQAQDEGLGVQDEGSGVQSYDRLGMRGKRLRMKVLVDENGLEDYDAIALSNQGFVSAAARKKRV